MSKTSRRGFLRTSAAGAALMSLPASTYRAAFGADESPSNKLRIGCVGFGKQGMGNLKAVQKNVVALCDVDKDHLAAAAKFTDDAGVKVQTFGDYRKMLEMKDLDAVVLTTPDHWHALQTIDSCKAGKDVYCEKPLSLTIAEGKAMVAAAREHKRVVQTGSQQRSDGKFRQACELVRNGAIGKITEVKVGLPGPNFSGPAVPDSDPPAVLDYDLWLGPAPERKYNAKHVHYLFRFFWDYSGGQQTNFGAHHLDITQWALGMDESGPTSIEATEVAFNDKKWFETPEVAKIKYTYANGVVVNCGLGKGAPPQGCTFVGEKGTIYVTRGKLEASDPEILKFAGGDVKLYVSKGHHADWLECIKTRKSPICDVAIGHRSATVCHLGNIAVRTGKKFTWDPVKEEVVGDSDAAKLVSKEYRAPWKLA